MASPELRGDTFQVDPAVEIICRNWRCSTPTTPDSPLSSALEARNKRIKKVSFGFQQITIERAPVSAVFQLSYILKTNQARQKFLFSGPSRGRDHHGSNVASDPQSREEQSPPLNTRDEEHNPPAQHNYLMEKSLRYSLTTVTPGE